MRPGRVAATGRSPLLKAKGSCIVLTGMALVEAIRKEQTDPPSGIRTLGLDVTHHWIESLEPGRVVLR
jgi:hypothetical protein